MDGIIIVNKPKQYTSNDIVNIVKKKLNTKVGHTGTLDPNATGVLPLLLGVGTKFSKYLINHDKKYVATIKLGEKTSTADSEGDIIETKNVDMAALKNEAVEKVLKTFVGKQTQIPPVYSAIKVNGKKLYEYARSGKVVDIPKRTIEIYKIKLVNLDENKREIIFEVECSKGTYIRTLCEDIAAKIGTVGYMKELNRVRVGLFNIESAVSIEDIENNKDNEQWLKENIIGLEEVLNNNPKYTIQSQEEFNRFLNGVKLMVSVPDGLYRIYFENELIGSGVCSNSQLKRDVIL